MVVKKYRVKKIIPKLLFGILMLVIIIPTLFPLYFVLISSSKSTTRVYIVPPKLPGPKPILDNYIYILKIRHYGTYMMNSTIVAVASTALSLLLGIPAVYAVARYKMGEASAAILTARPLPNISILLPYYFIFPKLRMIGTYDVLISSHMVLSPPLIVWTMMGFFSDLPLGLKEVAIVDGCIRQKYFRDVLLPVGVPGLVARSTLSFLGSWNNFQLALILSGERTRALSVSLQYFVSGADIRWRRMPAVTIVVIMSTIILTMLLRKYTVQGMIAGTVKGQGRTNGRNRPEAVIGKANMVIPVLAHEEGIYDSDAMKMKYTGMVLEESRIKGMGRFGELSQAYPDVRVADFSDDYILPGLVNAHIHLESTPCRDTYGIYRREDRKARLTRAAEHAGTLLRSGMITVRGAGGSMDLIRAPSGREAGSEPGAELSRIQTAGMLLTPDRDHLAFLGRTSNSTEELIQAVKERKSTGYGCVKLIVSGDQLTPGFVPERDTYNRGEIRAMVEATHKLGSPTAAHCLTTNSYVNTTGAGVGSVEHHTCFRKNRRLGPLERYYEPGVMEAFRGDRRYFMIGISSNYHQLDQAREGVRKPDEREAFLLKQRKRKCEILGRLADLGMCPLVGTDAGCGYTSFDEAWLEIKLLCRRYSLTPEEAIHATTLEGVRALGYGGLLGWLTPGYKADFTAVAQNPIQDIGMFYHIKHVVYRGKIIEQGE